MKLKIFYLFITNAIKTFGALQVNFSIADSRWCEHCFAYAVFCNVFNESNKIGNGK